MRVLYGIPFSKGMHCSRIHGNYQLSLKRKLAFMASLMLSVYGVYSWNVLEGPVLFELEEEGKTFSYSPTILLWFK